MAFRKNMTIWMTICIVGGLIVSVDAAEWEQPYPILGSCSGRDSTAFGNVSDPLYEQCMTSVGDEPYCSSLYPPARMPFAEWAPRYHGNVDAVIDQYLGNHVNEDFAYRRLPSSPQRCSGELRDTAPSRLVSIAQSLEPWAMSSPSLQSSDIAPVLLEYLRVYECSLAERTTTLDIWHEETERRNGLPGGLDANPLTYASLFEAWFEQGKEIREELRIARPTLERALALIGTIQMTRAIEQDSECIQRAGVDIRDAIALSADTASCLPRIWNARDPLRDPPPCSDGRDNDNDGSIDLQDESCKSPSDMNE